MTAPRLYLASASPRRSQLLQQVDLPHVVRPVVIDESPRAGEAPAAYVLRLAREKAQALWAQLAPAERLPILAADTTVALAGVILGKPADRGELRVMLRQLSGHTHEVHTAVAVLHQGQVNARVSTSEVSFREVTDAEIDWYWETGEPADKAGGYAVQGKAAIFIRHIAGSYSGVMGLPIYETWELLEPVLGLTSRSAAS
jgi:septum formation protein